MQKERFCRKCGVDFRLTLAAAMTVGRKDMKDLGPSSEKRAAQGRSGGGYVVQYGGLQGW